MKSIIKIVGILVIFTFIVGCFGGYSDYQDAKEAEEAAEAYKDQVLEATKDLPNMPNVDTSTTPTTTTTSPSTTTTSSSSYDEDIQDLIDKSKKVDNYHYYMRFSEYNKFQYYDAEGYEVFVRGDKIKKSYTSAIKVGTNLFVSDIYLSNGEAYATCTTTSVLCVENEGKAVKLNYAEHKIPFDILELMDKIPKDAVVTGRANIDSRSVLVLEYTNENGDSEELAVDKYYGIPMERTVYGVKDGDDFVKESYSFTDIIANNIKESDVTIPEGYN